MRPRRFELLTYSFGGCRSIQLSYGRIFIPNELRKTSNPHLPWNSPSAWPMFKGRSGMGEIEHTQSIPAAFSRIFVGLKRRRSTRSAPELPRLQ